MEDQTLCHEYLRRAEHIRELARGPYPDEGHEEVEVDNKGEDGVTEVRGRVSPPPVDRAVEVRSSQSPSTSAPPSIRALQGAVESPKATKRPRPHSGSSNPPAVATQKAAKATRPATALPPALPSISPPRHWVLRSRR